MSRLRTATVAVAASAVLAGAGAGASAWAQSRGGPQPAPTSTAGQPASAASPTATPTARPEPSAGRARPRAIRLRNALMRVDHATWVTQRKDGEFVTHHAIRGTVTAVSASSMTVRSGDGTSMTFALDAATRVGRGPREPGRIADVKAGDRVAVVGRGEGTPVAGRVRTDVR